MKCPPCAHMPEYLVTRGDWGAVWAGFEIFGRWGLAQVGTGGNTLKVI